MSSFDVRPMDVRIAVCLHIYYLEMLDMYLSAIQNVPEQHQVFLTCRPEIASEVSAQIERQSFSAKVIPCPNVGMDVLPFLKVFTEVDLGNFDVILKLHTKNNKTDLGRAHGSLMLNCLAGTKELVADVLQAFRNHDELYMVGPEDTYKASDFMMYGNRAYYEKIIDQVDYEQGGKNSGFFAGTSFWMRASVLRPFVNMYSYVQSEAETQAFSTTRTGQDGSIVHAIERAICANPHPSYALIGLISPKNSEYKQFCLRIGKPECLIEEKTRRLGASDVIRKHIDLARYEAIVKRSGLFDEKFYLSQAIDVGDVSVDALTHYLLYGELFELDPSADFSVSYYKLRRPDVLRKGVCLLVHFLQHGKKEGIKPVPSRRDWYVAAEKIGLFDDSWYSDRYRSVSISGLNSVDHYETCGSYLDYETSVSFRPAEIKILANPSENHKKSKLVLFVEKQFWQERRAYEEIFRVIQNGDYKILKKLCIDASDSFGWTDPLRAAYALGCVVEGETEASIEALRQYWNNLERGVFCYRHLKSLISPNPKGNYKFNELSANHIACIKKICIYTTLYGDIDTLPQLTYPNSRFDFICFTDRERATPGWTYLVHEPTSSDQNMSAKYYKILPHRLLNGYDYSLFIDANTLLMGNIEELIEYYLMQSDFALWRHPERSDLYAESIAIVEHRRHSPEKLMIQVADYFREGLPFNYGLCEASFIWRNHNNASISACMDDWWQQIQKYSRRDQLSLPYVLWTNNLLPDVLPERIGNSRTNFYFTKLAHQNPTSDVKKDTVKLVRSRQRDIWFLYHPKEINTGSTVLRGEQLHLIASRTKRHSVNIFYSSMDELSNKILFLTKGYLMRTSAEKLHALKKAGNILIADFVDMKIAREIVDCIDVIVSSSLSAYSANARIWSNKKNHHITHHVDLRIPPNREASSGFNVGYFGELSNTVFSDKVSEIVDFHSVDTSKVSIDWIEQLGLYSFHYAVRQVRKIDGYKPFLKGFTAAACHSNMLIQRDAGDAVYYLGAEYPFLIDSASSEDDILIKLQEVRASYGSPEWIQGLDVMRSVRERSSTDFVAREFWSLIDSL